MPLAVELNILIAVIMPLENKNMQFVSIYKCLHIAHKIKMQ